MYRASWTRRFDQDIPWPDGSFEAHPGPVVRMVGGEVLSGRKVRERERERERHTEEEREGGWEVTDRDHCLYSMSMHLTMNFFTQLRPDT